MPATYRYHPLLFGTILMVFENESPANIYVVNNLGRIASSTRSLN
jgi:hypothetical protein